MSANPSELDLLRQRITELEKRNVELEKEKSVLHAKNFDLENEVAKFRKELGCRIENVESRLEKVEQDSSAKQPQNERGKDVQPEVPSENDEVVSFLIEKNKKSISDEIRQRDREKKLQRESTAQEMPSVSQNSTSITSHERKNEQALIQELSLIMLDKDEIPLD